MSKITNKFAPGVRPRAGSPVALAAMASITEKVGCVPQTLHERVKKTEIDSGNGAEGRLRPYAAGHESGEDTCGEVR
jgi:transposase